MVLYGASGHAKVIIDILYKNKNHVKSIYDDNSKLYKILSYRVKTPPITKDDLKESFIISVGDNNIRKNISQKLICKYGQAIHPNSVIDITVKIGFGSVLMSNSVINSSSVIGNHVIINTLSSIDHDCYIDDFVHISPNACLCGGVVVGEGTHIGAGAVIIPNIKIGKWSVIGAGSVVITNIPDNVVVVGNPAKIIKENIHEK